MPTNSLRPRHKLPAIPDMLSSLTSDTAQALQAMSPLCFSSTAVLLLTHSLQTSCLQPPVLMAPKPGSYIGLSISLLAIAVHSYKAIMLPIWSDNSFQPMKTLYTIMATVNIVPAFCKAGDNCTNNRAVSGSSGAQVPGANKTLKPTIIKPLYTYFA